MTNTSLDSPLIKTDDSLAQDVQRESVNGHLLAPEDGLGNKSTGLSRAHSFRPVDKGYAWIILIATFLSLFNLNGYTKSLGIVFVEYQSKFGANASVTSLILSLTEIVGSVGGFLVMGLMMKYMSARAVTMIGAGFFVAGVAGNSLFSEIEYLSLTQGVFFGLAGCMIYGPVQYVLTQYFIERRPLATAIASCGTSLGGVVFPLLIRKLFDEYSFQGGILITGGFLLHSLVFGALMTPIENYDKSGCRKQHTCISQLNCLMRNTKKSKLHHDITNETSSNFLQQISKDKPLNISSNSDDSSTTERLLHTIDSTDTERQSSHNGKHEVRCKELSAVNKNKINELTSRELKQNESLCRSSNTNSSKTQRREIKELTNNEIMSYPDLTNRAHISTQSGGRQESIDIMIVNDHNATHLEEFKKPPTVVDILCSTSTLQIHLVGLAGEAMSKENLVSGNILTRFKAWCAGKTLLNSATFWALAFMFFCSLSGHAIPQMYIPALAEERGLTEVDAALFLSIMNILDFVSRLLGGVVVNFGWCRPIRAGLLPMIIVGMAGYMASFCEDYQSLLAIVVAYGLGVGVHFALQTLIVIDVLGVDNLRVAIGFFYLMMGIGATISYPICGALRVLTGTYSATYYFLATMNMVAAFILAVVVPLCQRLDMRRGVLDKPRETN
uniref:Major facilitator superfamily (MFS) profile domain-containing protein n=1 Tax=Biomphalaria glabrata TaxID=6526 RepID=A0A2C9KVH7_BIOGL